MKIVLLLVSFIIMSSCVGTIEKTEADASTIVPSKSKIVFGGITEAIAVAHNRLTVKFEAANGGSGQYDYSVYLNGNYSTPFTFIDGNLAITTSDGQLAIDVSGLDIGTSYSVGIRAKDRSTGVEDSNDVRVIASTLTYEVPLFSGVREVKNMPGIAAKNSLEVLWNKAIKSSDGPGGFSANPHEISGYRIYYRKDGQTSWLTKLISDPDITSNVLTSLDPQTSYEIKVVALDSDTPAISDENIRQISFSTLGDQPILFDGVSTATVAPNATGFNNIDLTWQAGTGGFDRYRIFYTDNPLTTSIDPQNQLDALNVDITDLTTTSYTLFVPNANTEYKVSVVACADALCSSYSSVSAAKVLIVKTSPPVAPFTGIDSIDVGLDRITLNWDFLPDATQGAYDSYEVLMTHNGNTTVLSNTGAVRLESIPATTAQSVNVVGVTEGEEYCFVVKSSITEPDYSKRVFENSAQFCGVPVYNAPGAVQVVEEVDPDNAPNLTKCIDIDTGKFTVKWTPPASGTYTKFQIFLDQGATLDYNGTEDAFVDFDPGLTEYSYTFNGLVAGQDYKVGIRTWFDHAGTIKTGLEISPIACTTDVDKLVPQGWENVISLGVKTDALNGGAVIPEVIVEKGDTLIDGTVVPFAAPIEFDEFLPTTPISLNSSLGSIGMVRLAWNDFKYTNGSYFSSNTNDANVGYKVYRLKYDHNTHANSHATLADPNWQELAGGSIIQAKTLYVNADTYRFAEFVDYTLLESDFGSATSDEARTVFYKVVPFSYGSQVALESNTPDVSYKDYVIKVIIPPKNMASVHRWMINKETCQRMQRASDRNNQYRCDYNGLGAREIPASSGLWYYDYSGHLLVDRFELGCNFSRNKCNNTEIGGTPGDCIGFDIPTDTLPSGGSLDGAVHYSRETSRGHQAALDNGFVTHKRPFCRLAVGNSFITTENMSGIQVAAAMSNESNLPPLQMVGQDELSIACAQRSVKLQDNDASNSLIKSYSNRLPRKDEYVAIKDTPFEQGDYVDIQDGNVNKACNRVGLGSTGANPTASSYGNFGFKWSLGDYGQKKDELDYSSYKYVVAPGYHISGSANESGYLPLIATGSSGGAQSTELCTHSYGIQDLSGNAGEFMSDKFWCTSIDSCDPVNTTEDNNLREEIYTNSNNSVLDMDDRSGQESIGLPLNYTAYIYPINNATYGNRSATYGVANNKLEDTNADYISVITGFPLICTSGAGCASDDKLASPKSSHPDPFATTNPISSFNYGANRLSYSVGYAKRNFSAEYIVLSTDGPVFHNSRTWVGGPYGDSNSANKYDRNAGRYSASLLHEDMLERSVGGRCATKIYENASGGFTP